MNQSVPSLVLSPASTGLDLASLQFHGMKDAIALRPLIASRAAEKVFHDRSQILEKSLSLQSSKDSSGNDISPIRVQGHSESEIKKVSRDFESIFLRMLFKEMRNSIEKTDLLGHSRAMEFFEQMQDEQLSDQLASAGGMGIGNLIYQKLKTAVVPHLKTFS